jgi:hypothetical protein
MYKTAEEAVKRIYVWEGGGLVVHVLDDTQNKVIRAAISVGSQGRNSGISCELVVDCKWGKRGRKEVGLFVVHSDLSG